MLVAGLLALTTVWPSPAAPSIAPPSRSPWCFQVDIVLPVATVRFDPSACAEAPRGDVRFVQCVRTVGIRADGSTLDLTFADQRFAQAERLDDLRTDDGWAVDCAGDESSPFYDDGAVVGWAEIGRTGVSPREAWMRDAPSRSPRAFGRDIVAVHCDFETAAVCVAASGTQYLGTIRWSWEQSRDGVVQLRADDGDVAAPSPQFAAALQRWAARHDSRVAPLLVSLAMQ